MKRALLIPVLALAACAQPGVGTVVIQAVCSPTKTCAFTGKCDAVALGNPIVDPGLTDYVTLIVQLENQLADNSDKQSGRTNTHDAVIDSAEIQFGGALGGKDVRGASGSVPAATTGLVWVDIIPATVFAPLLTSTAVPAWPDYVEVIANLQFRGNYGDGSHFTTAVFPVTIQVATGTASRPDSYVATCANACPHPGQFPAACP